MMHDGTTISDLIDAVERVQRILCECTDSTGYYVCGQPVTVFRLDYECWMCARCSKERP